MKKVFFTVVILATLVSSFAHADSIQLGFINTNDCVRAQNEVSLLSKADAQVSALCSDYAYQGYASDNGQRYNYRLYTTVTVPYQITRGMTIQLNDIDTNDCAWAQSEISILRSAPVAVQATCSAYSYQGYQSNNGQYYNYRLYTSVTVL